MSESRHTLGLVECISISHNGKSEKVCARIDTGASRCSIDIEFAKQINLIGKGKFLKVRSANGKSSRSLVQCTFHIGGKVLSAQTTLADRKHMKYKVLIGQNILVDGKFMVDPLIDGNSCRC